MQKDELCGEKPGESGVDQLLIPLVPLCYRRAGYVNGISISSVISPEILKEEVAEREDKERAEEVEKEVEKRVFLTVGD